MNKYFIIGAGLSGLRIGQLMARAGNTVEILEMDGDIGGLMRTEKRERFLFDVGPHIFFSDYANEYRELIGADLHNLRVLYGIRFNDRDIISPIRPTNLIRMLGVKQGLPLFWDVLQHKLVRSKAGVVPIDNAEKWVISNFGREAYRYFFKGYIPKVMGLPATKVTEEWGTERHKFYKEHNLWQKSTKFLVDFFSNKENRRGYLDVYYPEHGAQQVTDAIGREIQNHGATVHLRTMVEKIQVHEDRVTALIVNKDGIEKHIKVADGSVVLSTMPITHLLNALISTDADDSLSAMKKTSNSLRYRNLWLFNLVIKRDQLKDKVQIYFPERKYIFKRIYEPKNLLETPINDGKTAICVEVCYNDGDEVESMGEGEVYSRVLAGLRDAYNISDADILDMWSKKVPFAYSIYEIGYKESLKKLAAYMFGIDNLISFGRQGSFRYNHMTNRVMDACNTVYRFLQSGMTKKEFLISPDPKSDFF